MVVGEWYAVSMLFAWQNHLESFNHQPKLLFLVGILELLFCPHVLLKEFEWEPQVIVFDNLLLTAIDLVFFQPPSEILTFCHMLLV